MTPTFSHKRRDFVDLNLVMSCLAAVRLYRSLFAVSHAMRANQALILGALCSDWNTMCHPIMRVLATLLSPQYWPSFNLRHPRRDILNALRSSSNNPLVSRINGAMRLLDSLGVWSKQVVDFRPNLGGIVAVRPVDLPPWADRLPPLRGAPVEHSPMR